MAVVTAVIMLVVTAEARTVFATIFGATTGRVICVVPIVFMVHFSSRAMIAVVRAAIAFTTSTRLTLSSTTVASTTVGIADTRPKAVVITMFALVRGQMIQDSFVKIFFLTETHELADILHRGCFQLISSRRKLIAVQMVERAVIPLRGFFLAWIGFDSDG